MYHWGAGREFFKLTCHKLPDQLSANKRLTVCQQVTDNRLADSLQQSCSSILPTKNKNISKNSKTTIFSIIQTTFGSTSESMLSRFNCAKCCKLYYCKHELTSETVG